MNGREEYIQLHTERRQIAAKLKESSDALELAISMQQDALASLEQYDRLDGMIAKTRADALKRGDDPRSLPVELRQQVSARSDAQNELEATHLTRDNLDSEIADLRRQLALADKKLVPAAAAVLRDSVHDMAVELEQCRRRAWELDQILTGLDRTEHGAGVSAYRVGSSAQMAASLRGYHPGEVPGNVDLTIFVIAQWKKNLTALLDDPRTELQTVRPVRRADIDFSERSNPYLNP